jgi:hypothetical protein
MNRNCPPKSADRDVASPNQCSNCREESANTREMHLLERIVRELIENVIGLHGHLVERRYRTKISRVRQAHLREAA